MKKGKFIVIEGGEGSGKSSLLKALKEKMGDEINITREPGGSPFGELIRELGLKHPLSKDADAYTMICLMFASRFDHFNRLVLPLINKGKHVISDRFDTSSYGYQIYGPKALKVEKIFWNLRENLPIHPDIYIHIDVDVKEGLKRAGIRNSKSNEGNRFDDEKVDFHKNVKKGYKKFFNKIPHINIDANRPFEEVKKDFLKAIDSILN